MWGTWRHPSALMMRVPRTLGGTSYQALSCSHRRDFQPVARAGGVRLLCAPNQGRSFDLVAIDQGRLLRARPVQGLIAAVRALPPFQLCRSPLHVHRPSQRPRDRRTRILPVARLRRDQACDPIRYARDRDRPCPRLRPRHDHQRLAPVLQTRVLNLHDSGVVPHPFPSVCAQAADASAARSGGADRAFGIIGVACALDS